MSFNDQFCYKQLGLVMVFRIDSTAVPNVQICWADKGYEYICCLWVEVWLIDWHGGKLTWEMSGEGLLASMLSMGHEFKKEKNKID